MYDFFFDKYHCHPKNRIEKSKHKVLMPTKNTG